MFDQSVFMDYLCNVLHMFEKSFFFSSSDLLIFIFLDHFSGGILFETVSQSPNLENLKFKLWEKITGNIVRGAYDEIPQWQIVLQPRLKAPVLVVLDDVWTPSELEELIFKVPGCKTLVVSRFKFPTIFTDTYEMELLGEEEALSLFCSSAFDQQSIPPTADKKLVKQVLSLDLH